MCIRDRWRTRASCSRFTLGIYKRSGGLGDRASIWRRPAIQWRTRSS